MEIKGQTALALGGSQGLALSAATDLVKLVDDFPKTPTGKTQKNFFKDPYWAEKEKKI